MQEQVEREQTGGAYLHKNRATIKDAQEAQSAVAQARTVLRDFYAKASAATATVQLPATFDSDNPRTFLAYSCTARTH